jgi:hypothetical protein
MSARSPRLALLGAHHISSAAACLPQPLAEVSTSSQKWQLRLS